MQTYIHTPHTTQSTKMGKALKVKDRKMNSFMHKLAKSVGTATSSAVDVELDRMVKFALDKVLAAAGIICEDYAKQGETIKPNLLKAALECVLHGDLKENTLEASASGAVAFAEMKKSGGIRKAKKHKKAAEAAATAEVEASA